MSCSSSTICSHLSIPSCSSSSSSSSNSYKDVKTMFIGREHQKKLNIWTVAYSSSSSPLDNSTSLFIDPQTLNTQRKHCFLKDGKVSENNRDEESGFNARKKTLFLFIFSLIFIGVFLAVYYIFHLHRNDFLINFDGYNVNQANNGLKGSSKSFSLLNDHRKRVLDQAESRERIEELKDNVKSDKKVIEGEFRITNKIYNRNLKNRTSDAFQRLSKLINEQVKLLINRRKQLKPFQLNKVEIISLRKGDNLIYNLNGIIVELVLHFKKDVNYSLNEFVLNFISAKKDGVLNLLDIDNRTIKFKFKGQSYISDQWNLDYNINKRYIWGNWSEWGPICNNETGTCDEERVHSRARQCWDQLSNKPTDNLNCISESKWEHQSLQIEDCVCENKEEKCLSDEWKCLDSFCIPLSKRCDGHFNCFDESDEYDCECNEEEGEIHCGSNTSCISIDKKCNNITDCWDGSDEQGCPENPSVDYNYY